jgi:STE24 endopeptidase
LLEALSPDEVDAVLGHELGHVIGRHIPTYVAFALVFVFLSLSMELWATGAVQDPFVTGADSVPLGDLLLTGAVVAVYWGLFFGWISRRFEREADVTAVVLTGDSEVCAGALERIAHVNGRPAARPGWRHFSIASRADFLRRGSTDPHLCARAVLMARLLRGLLVLCCWGALTALLLAAWLR